MPKTTIILHSDQQNNQLTEQFKLTVSSIISQINRDFDVIFLGETDAETRDRLKKNSIETTEINTESKGFAMLMNEAIKKSEADYILYIDNRNNPVILKNAALEAFLICAERNPESGLFYADYELEDDGNIKEIKLLFHHTGRVRDNQDYGNVCFIRKEALDKISLFDESVKYNSLYDMRLKISEHLLAGKDVQIEAEEIVTNHLKRINAYLKPGKFNTAKSEYDDVSILAASVIIPVGFRPEFIGTAIESIQAQSVQDIEAIIVVNGGDNDPTIPEVKRYMKGGELLIV